MHITHRKLFISRDHAYIRTAVEERRADLAAGMTMTFHLSSTLTIAIFQTRRLADNGNVVRDVFSD